MHEIKSEKLMLMLVFSKDCVRRNNLNLIQFYTTFWQKGVAARLTLRFLLPFFIAYWAKKVASVFFTALRRKLLATFITKTSLLWLLLTSTALECFELCYSTFNFSWKTNNREFWLKSQQRSANFIFAVWKKWFQFYTVACFELNNFCLSTRVPHK